MALNGRRVSSNGQAERTEMSVPPLALRSHRAAEALGPLYNQLNQLWADAEARLKAMQVPRYVWVVYNREELDPENEYSPIHCECLGLVKVRGEWRLCLGQFVDDEFHQSPSAPHQPANWKPIADCSVEERVQAAPFVGELRAKIVDSAEHYISEVNEAIVHLSNALMQF